MLTARRRLKSPPVTIWYIHPPHHGHEQSTHIPFFPCQQPTPSHSSNQDISNFDLETTMSRSWVWSKGKTIQSAQYLIGCFLLFRINQITIPEIQLLWNLTLKIKGQGYGWDQRSRSHSSPGIQPMNLLFSFTSIGPTIPEIWPIECLTLKDTCEIFTENLPKEEFFLQNSSIM